MAKGREGNGRGEVRVRSKANRARDKKGDGRAVAAADARKRSNLLEGSKPSLIYKFREIFYTRQTRLDTHRTSAVSSLGSPLLPLQTPEDLGMGRVSQFTSCVRDRRAFTDANVDDLFLVASLSKHSPPGKRRSADGRDSLVSMNTYIGSTTSE